MQLTGRSIIGYQRGAKSSRVLNAFNPATAERLGPDFFSASDGEVEESVKLASASFSQYRNVPAKQRAAFLRSIAENIEELGEELVERILSETGLPAARIRSERARTCLQLRFFANMLERGCWVDARIDRGDPARKPVPKPDVRSMLRPVGPIVVFGASNFPLAFSVAGGDTSSALASGNTVIVLAHYAHPGTAELAGSAIEVAAKKHALPEGVFSLLFDSGHAVAKMLVRHPEVKAVSFTGSRAGGMSLMEIANSRPEPIPFYAEMSSINPVFILPSALETRSASVAEALHESATVGVGQFCTNPGVVITAGNSDALLSRFTELMSATPKGIMVNRNVASAYRRAVLERSSQSNVQVKSPVMVEYQDRMNECQAATAVFETDARSWLEDPALQNEIFGPATLLVRAADQTELLEIARNLEGNLTASIIGTPEDLVNWPELTSALEQKVGRVLFNAFPTGVEVCEAMVHGGLYPATSDGRSTSVGGRAILRFTRPVCYQNFPDSALPPELQEANPLGIWRMEDGQYAQPAGAKD